MHRFAAIRVAGLVCAVALHVQAQAQEKFTFISNWYAQAEHGGYYQALASGGYQKAGLDVTIKMGGPQVNVVQLLAAGQADCIMGSSDIQVFKTREQGVPAVMVAAIFQKDPQGFLTHTDVAKPEDLKGHPVYISAAARNTYWPWLKARYGLTDEQTKPFTFNLQPFMADPAVAIQIYATDPHTDKSKPENNFNFIHFAEYGWPAYSNMVVCLDKTLEERPKAVAAFLRASMEGWKAYLGGADRAAADAAIKKDNPQMTDAQIAYSIEVMRKRALVAGGDAAKGGIGVMTPQRLKATYDFMVAQKLLDETKVPFNDAFSLAPAQGILVLPDMGYVRIVSVHPDGTQPMPGEKIVIVDRTHSRLGNPFILADPDDDAERARVIAQYADMLERDRAEGGPLSALVRELADQVAGGQPLALRCWCAPRPCHSEVIRRHIGDLLGRPVLPPA